MRTDWQKREFVKECMEIEKAGGDVLGYIETNWPSYTPRATWYNLQKQYLGRKLYQLTEGHPKSKREEVKEMRRDKTELLKGVLKVLEEKGDPLEWLREQGYAYPQQAWADLRNWANKNNLNQGRLPENLKKYYARIRPEKPEKPDPAPAKEEPVGNPAEPEKAPETVVMNGKEYERMGPAPTCCQPARPSGVTVPDELPEEKPKAPGKQLQVCAVKSRIKGEWHLSQVEGCVHLIWEDRMTHEERSLGLPAADWMKLAGEIPQMLMQLGLAN